MTRPSVIPEDHPTPSRPCPGCAVCSGPDGWRGDGTRLCAAEARYRSDELFYEDKDAIADEARARNFTATPNRPPGNYVAASVREPARRWAK